MTIQYASDLHLEFAQNKEYIKMNPLKPVGDILVLAGDITPFSQMDKHNNLWDYVAAHWQSVYWVPGNHEYYGYDMADRQGSFCIAIRPNVFLVNNHTEVIDGTKLIFSTLWSKISLTNQWTIQQSLSDFHTIKYRGQKLTVDDYNEQHLVALQYVTSQLAIDERPAVVVTHHVPTLKHYPEQYRGDVLNEAFASEQYELILKHQPIAWIYGHHHQNTPDFNIDNTQLLTNQMGYLQYREHTKYNNSKIINLTSHNNPS
jgi:3',5'-cyclic AMP phosphodiesterase CpdA